MKMLIVIILALAAATTIGLISVDDPGLMVLSYGQHSLELPLVLALLFIAIAFAILYLLFNFLFSVLRAPKKAKKWNQQRQNKNAQNDTLRGYARLIEGDWAHGEKALLKRMEHCKTPMLNYLGAAYAAQQQQNYDKRDEYLAAAEKIDPANRMAIDITRARMLTQAGEYDKARALLTDMQRHAPGNKSILRLMADVCRQTEDWEGAQALLPRLAKTKALPEAQLLSLEMAVRSVQLSDAVPDQDKASTLAQYKKLPGKRKKDAQMAALYARQLIQEGDLSTAEGVIRKAMNKQWSSELAGLYGQTRIENLRRQITLATSWLTEHEGDPNISLTLARLNEAYEQHDKARIFYNLAIEQGAGEEAYYELGQFYEDEGNHKTALIYYKQGIKASISEAVDPLPSVKIDATQQLGSVVTPGAGDVTLTLVPETPKVNTPDSVKDESIEDAQVIEHKGTSNNS